MAKLGFQDRKTKAPENLSELVGLLGEIMSASLNNEVDLDNARIALNAATRMVDAIQADTRMKALAIATQRTIGTAHGAWPTLEVEKVTSA